MSPVDQFTVPKRPRRQEARSVRRPGTRYQLRPSRPRRRSTNGEDRGAAQPVRCRGSGQRYRAKPPRQPVRSAQHRTRSWPNRPEARWWQSHRQSRAMRARYKGARSCNADSAYGLRVDDRFSWRSFSFWHSPFCRARRANPWRRVLQRRRCPKMHEVKAWLLVEHVAVQGRPPQCRWHAAP